MLLQNMPFLGIGNFTGCLSEILLNGENLELWFLATSAQIGLQPCSRFEWMIMCVYGSMVLMQCIQFRYHSKGVENFM